MNQLDTDWFPTTLWTEPQLQLSLVKAARDRDDVIIEAPRPSTMDSATYFGRYEEWTASTFMQRTAAFVAVKRPPKTSMDGVACFVAKTRRSTRTMARPAGRALHRTALPFPGSVPAPFPIRSAQRERRSDSK